MSKPNSNKEVHNVYAINQPFATTAGRVTLVSLLLAAVLLLSHSNDFNDMVKKSDKGTPPPVTVTLIVTLNAKPCYTFAGMGADIVIHSGATTAANTILCSRVGIGITTDATMRDWRNIIIAMEDMVIAYSFAQKSRYAQRRNTEKECMELCFL